MTAVKNGVVLKRVCREPVEAAMWLYQEARIFDVYVWPETVH